MFSSKLHWIKDKLTKKQFIFVSSVLVGLSAGLAAVLLKLFVHFILWLISENQLVKSQYFYVILPILGIFLTYLIVKFLLKGKLEKGISNLHIIIKKKSSYVPKEQMYAQIITSSVTVGFGGSAGLEAPIVLTGAAFGSNYAKTYKLNYKDRTLLLACGVAAGIAAVFSAPIAGVLFALEVLLLDVGITAFIPLILAAASGALISKVILGSSIILSFKSTLPFDYKNVPFYILVGIFCGLISVYHARMFSRIEHAFQQRKISPVSKIIIGGSILALLILIFPSLYGEGFESIKLLSDSKEGKVIENSILQPYITNQWLVLLFLGVIIFFKSIATALTVASGGNGGNFAPSLFVGAYVGFFISRLINSFGYFKLPEGNFTLVGMAGFLSGMYHAPLTSIFLIAEITGGYTLMIPLMIVASISFAISRYFETQSADIKKLGLYDESFALDKDKAILSSIPLKEVIEKDYEILHPENNLGKLIEILKKSSRNIFPVINDENQFLGIVATDTIKEIMFDTRQYNKIFVKDLIYYPKNIIDKNDSPDIVMAKFEREGVSVLPVLSEQQFIGFITKSSILSKYRTKLINSMIE